MHKLLFICALGLMQLPIMAAAQPSLQSTAQNHPFIIKNSNVFDYKSNNGTNYRIYTAYPDNPPPKSGYPVIYVLDGDDNFAIAAEVSRRIGRFSDAGNVEKGVIVAIGYADKSNRSYDNTPKSPNANENFGGRPTGGAEGFYNFIESELKPQIEKSFPIDKNRQAIVGHSFGGLFVIDVFQNHPNSFQEYYAISPALWYGDNMLLQRNNDFLKSLNAPTKLSIMTGSLEEDAKLDPQAKGRNMVSNAKAINAKLAQAAAQDANPNFKTTIRILDGESHGSTIMQGLFYSISQAFEKRK